MTKKTKSIYVAEKVWFEILQYKIAHEKKTMSDALEEMIFMQSSKLRKKSLGCRSEETE